MPDHGRPDDMPDHGEPEEPNDVPGPDDEVPDDKRRDTCDAAMKVRYESGITIAFNFDSPNILCTFFYSPSSTILFCRI